MKKVDFLIVGAMRSGTSSLRDALALNPHIDMARGEPMFFTRDFALGFDHYHAHFDWDGQHVIHGEKSPPYAVDPFAPERVRDYNPSAKIVWILRDPVKRAVSHFQHSSFRTNGAAVPLRDAIRMSGNMRDGNSTMDYVFRSQYDRHIKGWVQFFPMEQQIILVLEEVLAAPELELGRLHKFLGVPMHCNVTLPHAKSQKMAKFVDGMEISPQDVRELERVLAPTKRGVEKLLQRRISAWGTKRSLPLLWGRGPMMLRM
jgi:hypothetical protein